jgi:penicillin amidase
VDELLPKPADKTGPVALRWLGAHEGGWLTALLGMNRADSSERFREAVRPWHVPLFSLVIADVDGHIAYQAAGRIPQRLRPERGYRCGADPADEWQGVIPFEHMPRVVDPPRGWIATANNRLAPADYPYPLFGCWQSGWRAKRIRQMIESREHVSPADLPDMHQDAKSLRAAACVPHLVAALQTSGDPRIQQAVKHLREWDLCCEPGSVATAIFNVFFSQWCRAVAEERFEPEAVELMSKGVESCAIRLLEADPNAWFRVGRIVNPSDKQPAQDASRHSGRIDNPSYGRREQRIAEAMQAAINVLTARLGPDMAGWTWGRLHRLPLRHVLSSRGDLGQLLDHGGVGVRGDMTTVCNTGGDANWLATTGAGYRFIADLSGSPPRLMAVDAQSQSGHPGSPNYSDQLETWLAGGYHEIPLDRAEVAKAAVTELVLAPRDG